MSTQPALRRAEHDDGGAPVLAALDRWLGHLETALTLIAAACIFGLMLLGVAQVLGRKLLNLPVSGYIDVVEFVMAVFAFMGAAYCQRLGAHVRMEILLQHLKGRPLWVLEALATIVALGVVAVIIVYAWDHFVRAYEFGDSTIDIELPLWPSKLIVPTALAILWLRLLLQLAGFLRLVCRPDVEPVAVPRLGGIELEADRELRVAVRPDR